MREAAGIWAVHSRPDPKRVVSFSFFFSRAFFRVPFLESTQNSAQKRDRESSLLELEFIFKSFLFLWIRRPYLTLLLPTSIELEILLLRERETFSTTSRAWNSQREKERDFGNGWHYSEYGDRSVRRFSGGAVARRSVSAVQHLWEPLRGHGKVPPSDHADRSRRVRNRLVFP